MYFINPIWTHFQVELGPQGQILAELGPVFWSIFMTNVFDEFFWQIFWQMSWPPLGQVGIDWIEFFFFVKFP